jgi:hypothetical protein
MSRFNLVGPSYQSSALPFDAQLTHGWYLNPDETGQGRSAAALFPAPGLHAFANLAGCSAVLSELVFEGRFFAVGQFGAILKLVEVSPGGAILQTVTFGAGLSVGPIYMVGTPATGSNTFGVPILSVAFATEIFQFNMNTFGVLATQNAQSYRYLEYVDDFLVALLAGNQFQIFGPNDPTVYNALNIATVTEFPDNVVGMIANDRIIYLFGEKRTVPYYNSGALFPFVPVPGVFIEKGLVGQTAMCRADNTVFWLHADERGSGTLFRLSGYTGQRVSTFPIEEQWNSFETITDAVLWSYEEAGHEFVVCDFPTGNATFVYDVATQQWHNRGYFNPNTNQMSMQRQWCHGFFAGMHIVGDSKSGNLYIQSIEVATDNGNPIRRIRTSPPIAAEHEWIFHQELEVLLSILGNVPQLTKASTAPVSLNLEDANGVLWQLTVSDAGAIQVNAAPAGATVSNPVYLTDDVNQSTWWQLAVTTGGVLQPVAAATNQTLAQVFAMATSPSFKDVNLLVSQAGVVSASNPVASLRGPQLELSWSNDGGRVFNQPIFLDCGKAGDYSKRVIARRLGKSRNRIYRIATSDPVLMVIIDGFLKATDNSGNTWKPSKRLAAQLAEVG